MGIGGSHMLGLRPFWIVDDRTGRVLKPQCARLIHRPRAGECVGIGQPNVRSDMIRKVEVVVPKGLVIQVGTRISDGPLMFSPSLAGSMVERMIGLPRSRSILNASLL